MKGVIDESFEQSDAQNFLGKRVCREVEEGLTGWKESERVKWLKKDWKVGRKLMCCGCQNLAVRAKAVCFHVDLDSLIESQSASKMVSSRTLVGSAS